MQYLNPATATPQLQSFFAAAALDYVIALSERLLADPACRELPDLLALGFWFRRQKISALRQKYQAMPYQLKPLGLVYHNTPANVDSLFMYPALLSLLCGNCNLIRLSSRAGQSAAVLLKHVGSLAEAYPVQNAALQFVQAPHQDAELLATFEQVDGRVLWGSDAAIIAQRQLPVAAHCRDLNFSHKMSLTLLDANAVCQAPDAEFQAMTELFSRDHLTYAQQACASAKVVVWLGQTEDIRQAQQRFWPTLIKRSMQQALLTDSDAYQALAGAQQLLLSSENYQDWQTGQLQRLRINDLDTDMLRLHPGCGLFLELPLQSLNALTPMLNNSHQTLSHWGIDSKLLKDWYPAVLRGADRLVPLGQSLQFAEVWDGVDLVLQFSRLC
ncbi:MAG: acyl-CoA reductase [Gammaproteobacteria bacterium]|nr:acyl-CoA reductase [Gammaproteobacteria bacterium]